MWKLPSCYCHCLLAIVPRLTWLLRALQSIHSSCLARGRGLHLTLHLQARVQRSAKLRRVGKQESQRAKDQGSTLRVASHAYQTESQCAPSSTQPKDAGTPKCQQANAAPEVGTAVASPSVEDRTPCKVAGLQASDYLLKTSGLLVRPVLLPHRML